MNTAPKQENLFPTGMEYTIQRNAIRFYAENVFNLHPQILQYFDNYYILYWEGDYILTANQQGTIIKDGIPYMIRYKGGLHRGKMLTNRHNQFALSFRNPGKQWQIPAIVLIRESK